MFVCVCERALTHSFVRPFTHTYSNAQKPSTRTLALTRGSFASAIFSSLLQITRFGIQSICWGRFCCVCVCALFCFLLVASIRALLWNFHKFQCLTHNNNVNACVSSSSHTHTYMKRYSYIQWSNRISDLEFEVYAYFRYISSVAIAPADERNKRTPKRCMIWYWRWIWMTWRWTHWGKPQSISFN